MGYLHLCHALIQTHIIHSFIHSASIHLALLGCSTPILRIVCEYKINHIAPSASLVGQAQIVETTGVGGGEIMLSAIKAGSTRGRECSEWRKIASARVNHGGLPGGGGGLL